MDRQLAGTHPSWCTQYSNDGTDWCGNHLSKITTIPATAGSWTEPEFGDGSTEFPGVNVAAVRQGSGMLGVSVLVCDPTTQARTVDCVTTLLEAVDLADALRDAAGWKQAGLMPEVFVPASGAGWQRAKGKAAEFPSITVTAGRDGDGQFSVTLTLTNPTTRGLIGPGTKSCQLTRRQARLLANAINAAAELAEVR